MDDIVYLSLTEMAESIRAKKISPVQLIDAHLSRIDELNPKLNAFVTVDGERARAQAKSAEIALGSCCKIKFHRPTSRRADLHQKFDRCCGHYPANAAAFCEKDIFRPKTLL